MKSRRYLKIIFLIFSLFIANLSVYAKKLPEKLIKQLIADINNNENNFRLSEEDIMILRENLKFNLHDLNSDKIKEYFLYIKHSDWCGAGSNCTYWIYQKDKRGYNFLLEGTNLSPKTTISNGYKDLLDYTKVSSCNRGFRYHITYYKFNGRKYVALPSNYKCLTSLPK